MIRWLERNGYWVNYSASDDTHARPELMGRHRALILSGHDEFWTKEIRDNVEGARDAGVHLADGLPSARGQTWAVKLNLTCPRYIRGVVNSPVFVEGMCQWASDHGVKLVFVEGAGGNGSYSVDDTFRGNGLAPIGWPPPRAPGRWLE